MLADDPEFSPSTNRNTRAGSMVDRLLRMEAGETICVSRRLDAATGDLRPDTLTAHRRRLVSSITKPIFRVQERHPQASYSIETALAHTSGNAFHLCAFIVCSVSAGYNG